MYFQDILTTFTGFLSFFDSLFPMLHHWADFRFSTIVWWPLSVSALPFDQMIFLFPFSIHATSILPVRPVEEWLLISMLGKASWSDFLSLRAGPPYPHPPQYSISITLGINKIIKHGKLRFYMNYRYSRLFGKRNLLLSKWIREIDELLSVVVGTFKEIKFYIV